MSHFGLAVIIPLEGKGEARQTLGPWIFEYTKNLLDPYLGETNKHDGRRLQSIESLDQVKPSSAPYAFIGLDGKWHERPRREYAVEKAHAAEFRAFVRTFIETDRSNEDMVALFNQWDDEHPMPVTPWHHRFHEELAKVQGEALVLWFDCHR